MPLNPACRHLFLTVALAGALCPAAEPAERIEKSGEWELIRNGEYLLENNFWNIRAAAGRSWKQGIFCEPATGLLGWRWDFSGENDVLKTYPEVIFGRKPYDGYTSTTPRLPAPLASARFRLEYDYRAKAPGATYNTTTDITFTDSATPAEKNIKAKLMIWFDRQHVSFFDQKPTTRAVISGRPHRVYIDREHNAADGKWIFIALLPEDLPASGELNFTDYFAHLLAEGVLQPEWFLASIEVGSEIASGTGEIVFHRFVVH